MGSHVKYQASWVRIGEFTLILLALVLFVLAVQLVVGAFNMVGTSVAQTLLQLATNPFTALFIGLLATALIQSSSTTTSLVVSIVAVGGLSIEGAIPIILGANVGTAITSTIVALGHIGNRSEFEKAVAGAALHDFFNIISVGLLFTFEVTTHGLTSTATYVSSQISTLGTAELFSLLWPFQALSSFILQPAAHSPFGALAIALLALFLSLRLLIWVMRRVIIGPLADNINRLFFGRPLIALLSGFGTTALMQSSSVTTSVLVPFIATDRVTLPQAFPFLMGANVGTTLTALVAALFSVGEGSSAALAVAFTHLLINLVGVLILYPVPRIRNLPIQLAASLGRLTLQNRLYGVIYIVGLFFILPFLLILLSEGPNWLL